MTIYETSGKKRFIPQPKCELLGPVSILIQFSLGLIAVSSLVLKRRYEYPKRPWKVWIFDVSKQVLGSLGIHLLNLTVSLLKSKGILLVITGNGTDEDEHSECDWYFVNLLMDTTVGVPILYVLLFIIYHIAEALGIKDIDSGNYGKPPRYTSFFKQLLIFFFALILMKGIIYTLLYIPVFILYADWILSFSDGFPNLQIVLIMLVFPTILNCFQYYITDSIIKFPTTL